MARKRSGTLSIPKVHLDSLALEFGKSFNPANAQLMFTLRAVAQRINERANLWLAPLGLSATKFNYLVALYANRATGLTLNDVSRLVHTSNASVTSMIDSLERDELVKRGANPADRRSTVVKLTPKGRTLVRKAFIEHHARIDAALKPFSAPERRTLLDLLQRVGANLDTDT
jgi:DNA-binding MarR family transcriptional regulator